MKRLFIVAAAALAFSATPAVAADIPHGDTSPDNWGALWAADQCGNEQCAFSATTTDTVITFEGGGPAVCNWMTMDYEIQRYSNFFYSTGVDYDGPCPALLPRTMKACVYSPSGFASGDNDIEFWIRDSTSAGGVIFGSVSGSVTGNQYAVTSWHYDDQLTHPQSTARLDGTMVVDGSPFVFEHELGDSECGFDELT